MSPGLFADVIRTVADSMASSGRVNLRAARDCQTGNSEARADAEEAVEAPKNASTAGDDVAELAAWSLEVLETLTSIERYSLTVSFLPKIVKDMAVHVLDRLSERELFGDRVALLRPFYVAV